VQSLDRHVIMFKVQELKGNTDKVDKDKIESASLQETDEDDADGPPEEKHESQEEQDEFFD